MSTRWKSSDLPAFPHSAPWNHLECSSKTGAFGKGVAGKFIITENMVELSTVNEVSCINNEQKSFYLFSRNVNFELLQHDKK